MYGMSSSPGTKEQAPPSTYLLPFGAGPWAT